MRTLFYLPVVTPWWFDNIVAPLVKTMASLGDVHLVVPPLYRGTGIGDQQLRPLTHLPNLSCHVIDGEETHHFRMNGQDGDFAAALVEEIDPDYVLARTADRRIGNIFPGEVRFLMEGGMWPLPVSDKCVRLSEDMLDFGCMPDLTAEQEKQLAGALLPVWRRLAALDTEAGDRASYCRAAGLPEDKKIVAVALEYEHEENAYASLRLFRSNAALLATLLAELPEDVHLAVTNHPLNELYADNWPVTSFIAANPGRLTHVTERTDDLNPTQLLTRHCDGIVVELSKSFTGAVFFGKPILRLSELPFGDWLGSYRSISRFFDDVRTGTPLLPDRRAGEVWLSYHLANCILDPRKATAEQLVESIERPFNSDRGSANLENHRELYPELRPA